MTGIKPRTARVVIYQGDDIARLADLDAAVAKAEAALRAAERAVKNATAPRLLHEAVPEDTVIDATQAHEAAKVERDEFAAEAEARGVVVVMHAQPRRAWRKLMEEHAPRDGVRDDEALGVNMETLPDALLPASIDRNQSTIEGDTVEFLDSLADYDYYDRLFLTAFALNRGSAMADPTLRLVSETSRTSGATSS